jgi:hypothetical protein
MVLKRVSVAQSCPNDLPMLQERRLPCARSQRSSPLLELFLSPCEQHEYDDGPEKYETLPVAEQKVVELDEANMILVMMQATI